MEYDPRIPALLSDNGSSIQPYRFLFSGTMIRNGRHDQVVQDMRRSVRDNLWFSSELDEPLIYRCAILRNLASGIVMIPRADRNASYLCQLADPPTDLPRLFHPRLFPKHIQQVPCYADQMTIRRTT